MFSFDTYNVENLDGYKNELMNVSSAVTRTEADNSPESISIVDGTLLNSNIEVIQEQAVRNIDNAQSHQESQCDVNTKHQVEQVCNGTPKVHVDIGEIIELKCTTVQPTSTSSLYSEQGKLVYIIIDYLQLYYSIPWQRRQIWQKSTTAEFNSNCNR